MKFCYTMSYLVECLVTPLDAHQCGEPSCILDLSYYAPHWHTARFAKAFEVAKLYLREVLALIISIDKNVPTWFEYSIGGF